MKLSIVNICLFILLGCTSFKQGRQSDIKQVDFSLEIKQFVSGSYTQNTFVIVGDKFFIFQNSTTKEGQSERKVIYSKRVKANSLSEIKHASNLLFSLKSEYIKAAIGGLRWEITLADKERIKKIIVENYSVKELDTLFNLINKIIPDKKPIIYMY
ncbi:MAG: hypothetical protein OHK0036_09240 [Bacteroidia bacterium]